MIFLLFVFFIYYFLYAVIILLSTTTMFTTTTQCQPLLCPEKYTLLSPQQQQLLQHTINTFFRNHKKSISLIWRYFCLTTIGNCIEKVVLIKSSTINTTTNPDIITTIVHTPKQTDIILFDQWCFSGLQNDSSKNTTAKDSCCSICLDAFHTSKICVQMKCCRSSFHFSCLRKLLKSCFMEPKVFRCPMCRCCAVTCNFRENKVSFNCTKIHVTF